MTREIIAQRIMQCTPEELQYMLGTIHGWVEYYGDEIAGEVETVQDIIDLLSRPEYIQCAEECEAVAEGTYFAITFGIWKFTKQK